MKKETVDHIKEHALQEYANEKKESCGLVLSVKGKERYIPCQNIAEKNPKTGEWDNFIISPRDFALAEDMGDIIAVVHSHPDASARPSEGDKVECERSGLNVPWIIVSVFEDGVKEVYRHDPDGYVAPLIGREFFYGTLDCFSIIQDYYEREFSIHIGRVPSKDGWWEGEEEIYLHNYEAAGFVTMPQDVELRKGDIILMQVRSDRVNHSAVFLGGERLTECPDRYIPADAMLHHFHGRLSEITIYGGHWKDLTRRIIRHKDLL